MKKLTIFLTFFLLFSNCEVVSAQTWHTANQATIAWDQVTQLETGDPVPVGSIVKYQLYYRNDTGVVTKLTEVDTTQGTVTFTVEGSFLIGVSAMRYEGTEGNLTLLSESQISWSDVGAVTPDPFGFRFYKNPAAPRGLRKQ